MWEASKHVRKLQQQPQQVLTTISAAGYAAFGQDLCRTTAISQEVVTMHDIDSWTSRHLAKASQSLHLQCWLLRSQLSDLSIEPSSTERSGS